MADLLSFLAVGAGSVAAGVVGVDGDVAWALPGDPSPACRFFFPAIVCYFYWIGYSIGSSADFSWRPFRIR